MTNAERSRLHRSRNRFCRTRLKQVMDVLYSHFPDAWLFIYELEPPSEFPVRPSPPRANAGQQPGIRPEPQPRPQPGFQPKILSEPQPRPQQTLQPEIQSEPQSRPQRTLQPEPQPRPQPALQPEPPCIDKLMDELFGSASPQFCEGELDLEIQINLRSSSRECQVNIRLIFPCLQLVNQQIFDEGILRRPL